MRALTQDSLIFNNMTNLYDNFMDYQLLVNRLRRLLIETFRKEQVSVLVGKIWILNAEQDTVKIKDSLQASFCRLFSNHKVSYNNNIFYITYSVFSDITVEDAQHELSKQMSKAIRKVADKIEPDELICCVLDTKTKEVTGNYEEFFNKMNYVELTPDDYCGYSEAKMTEEEENKTAETPLEIKPKEDENDKIMKRVKLYKQLVAVLITIAGILILLAVLALTILR